MIVIRNCFEECVHKNNLLTASLAFLSLSSILALFRVPTRIPNIDFPRLRSRPAPRSRRGRFLFPFSGIPLGLFAVSATSIWAAFGETLDGYSQWKIFLQAKWTYSSEDILEAMKVKGEWRHTFTRRESFELTTNRHASKPICND